jgi:hypothetical protein
VWRVVMLAGLMMVLAAPLRAQDTDGPLSEAEVESLREMAPLPLERMRAFEKILDTRAKQVEDLLSKPRRPGYAIDMHDALDQFGQIADELNDNLDEWQKGNRDVRKELPKLMKNAERWATVLRSPPPDGGYDIVKKIALNNLGDLREMAGQMQTEQEAYFKAHPEAAKTEKQRAEQ